MQASLQGKDNAIRQLKKQLSELDAHLDYLRHLKKSVEIIRDIVEEAKVIVLWYLDSGCSIHMTGDRSRLLNFVKKFIGTVRFRNDHFGAIMGYGDYVVGESVISRVGKVWKPIGKVLTTIGHQWRHTGRILHLGKQFPLTRFTPPQVVSAAQNKKQASCLKHMTGDHSRLLNFVKKFIGIVRFENDHFGAIMGYGDYMVGESVIFRVYYVEGLGHNLFSVKKFCDSNLEVAFRKHSCYVRDTDGVDPIKGSRGSNLHTISVKDMMKSSLICLLFKASKDKSCLWHRRLNHLNFDTINDLARKDLV
uniref:Integrase, catalytic region, zinc finger, CCHC-type, peptidase aspartic, catalytic n=1 Tax=Tanacetum cinerariifolium TaxID=118510 RepID=A0A699KAR3_TANCI|nr:integrase, catalytic region, zinc finger, CCHC-type, peptidase aspartic, catalytic [Tanacetum cinerariifolium]